MNTENSKESEPHRFKLDLTGKLSLNPRPPRQKKKKRKRKKMALANLSIYCAWKNIKSEYNNNKFKISAQTWHGTFDLPDGSYSIDDIQDYFELIIKKHETLIEYLPVRI